MALSDRYHHPVGLFPYNYPAILGDIIFIIVVKISIGAGEAGSIPISPCSPDSHWSTLANRPRGALYFVGGVGRPNSV